MRSIHILSFTLSWSNHLASLDNLVTCSCSGSNTCRRSEVCCTHVGRELKVDTIHRVNAGSLIGSVDVGRWRMSDIWVISIVSSGLNIRIVTGRGFERRITVGSLIRSLLLRTLILKIIFNFWSEHLQSDAFSGILYNIYSFFNIFWLNIVDEQDFVIFSTTFFVLLYYTRYAKDCFRKRYFDLNRKTSYRFQ